MPTYEYSCEKCGKNFDAFQSMKDNPFSVCPKEKCQMEEWGEGKVKRQIGTGAGLIFKGSGFYITDYRSENYKKGQKSESPSPAPSGGDAKSSTPKTDATKPTPAKTESAKPASSSTTSPSSPKPASGN